MKITFILLLALVQNVYGYVHSKTQIGDNVKWTKANRTLDFYVNPNPVGFATSSINSTDVESIVNESVNEWNSISKYKLSTNFTTSLPPMGTSKTLSFSSSSEYFGSGVLAVTRLTYNATSGDISAADILINDSPYNFTSLTKDKSDSSHSRAYLGDIITHELGHFFGLSHSEHIHSSMIYSVFKGQYSIHSDDEAGILDLYDVNQRLGEISGRVIGGNDIALFGVRVTAISTISGGAVQAQLTNELGEFNFKNLSLNDSYYIMVSPYKNLENISSTDASSSRYYSTAKYNFCSQKDFKETFYTQCGPRSKSIPQTFYLESNTQSIDVGDITIRCDENINTDYYANKFKSDDRTFELNDNTNKTSFLFNGLFLESEIDASITGEGDDFSIDLSGMTLDGVDPSTYKLRLKFETASIGSGIDLYVVTKRLDQVEFSNTTSIDDIIGKKQTDFFIDLPLSSNSNDNVFEIKIYPVSFTQTELYEIFSTPSTLVNNSSQYIMNAQVGIETNGSFIPLNPLDSYPYEDNSTCTEGDPQYTVSAYTSLSSSSNISLADDEDIVGISCGTIDIDDDSNSSGMGSLVIGIMLMFTFCSATRLKHQIKTLNYWNFH